MLCLLVFCGAFNIGEMYEGEQVEQVSPPDSIYYCTLPDLNNIYL